MLLRVLVFICGAALMALEILGARVFAPSLGNSIFVWGALISSFMIAMSIGYWMGGLASEKHAHLRALGFAAASSGALTVLIPIGSKPVLAFAATLGPRLGPLTAALLVFFLPTVLISTVSPLAVRIAALHPEKVGRTAGSLYALSTAGSILGSLGTAFWLIPLAPVDSLVVGTGMLLAVTGLVAALAPGEATASRPAWVVGVSTIAGFALLAGIGSLSGSTRTVGGRLDESGERIVFRKDTQYHRITVSDRSGVRSLRFDNRRQSAIDMSDGYTSDIAYTNYLHLAMALKPDAKRVLVLGLGGGALPKRMWRDYPDVSVDSVEIDPVVIDVAKRYFGMPEDERLRVFTGDARQYVASTKDRYDVVVVDAYYADALPFHLATDEFFKQVKDVLNPEGVIAYNVISSVEGERSRLFRSFYRTVSRTWRDVYVFPIGIAAEGDPGRLRNIIMLASDGAVPNSILLDRVRSSVDGSVTVKGFPSYADDLYTKPVSVKDVPVLTDRYAPVDSLIRIE